MLIFSTGQEDLLRELRRPTSIPDYVERDNRRKDNRYDDEEHYNQRYNSVCYL